MNPNPAKELVIDYPVKKVAWAIETLITRNAYLVKDKNRTSAFGVQGWQIPLFTGPLSGGILHINISDAKEGRTLIKTEIFNFSDNNTADITRANAVDKFLGNLSNILEVNPSTEDIDYAINRKPQPAGCLIVILIGISAVIAYLVS